MSRSTHQLYRAIVNQELTRSERHAVAQVVTLVLALARSEHPDRSREHTQAAAWRMARAQLACQHALLLNLKPPAHPRESDTPFTHQHTAGVVTP
ncbi:hypothetical protein RIF23_02210 [Lipingzhangella sp. LS1_29]|uniref:Uncharacterized protein n=1 Tax=Lipingzhangella rawalii TaxID=2055835 RepID=A0ABU2H2Q8_9ACTN|nr:hypothetical protein [Lipingzhangella rawalii]MDS1269105.1 hypothetical protein [Lipingzhangella rawalii]